MVYALCGIAGIIVGVIVSRLLLRFKPLGTLLVVKTELNPEPYLLLDELAKHPNEIKKMKYITFKIGTRG